MNDAGRRRERRTYCINPRRRLRTAAVRYAAKIRIEQEKPPWTPAAERSVFRGVRCLNGATNTSEAIYSLKCASYKKGDFSVRTCLSGVKERSWDCDRRTEP
jgi:hypothetical protein